MCVAAGALCISLTPWQHPLSTHSAPTQHPHSTHTVPTQSPLVKRGTRAFKSLNLLHMFSTLFKHPTFYGTCGCCVGAEWTLSGYCCVCGRGHKAHFLWSCRASRFNSSGAGHGMSSHGRRGRAALWASIAQGHRYRKTVYFLLVCSMERCVRPSNFEPVLVINNHTPHCTINPYCYVLSGCIP